MKCKPGPCRWERVLSGAYKGWWKCSFCGRKTSKSIPTERSTP